MEKVNVSQKRLRDDVGKDSSELDREPLETSVKRHKDPCETIQRTTGNQCETTQRCTRIHKTGLCLVVIYNQMSQGRVQKHHRRAQKHIKQEFVSFLILFIMLREASMKQFPNVVVASFDLFLSIQHSQSISCMACNQNMHEVVREFL